MKKNVLIPLVNTLKESIFHLLFPTYCLNCSKETHSELGICSICQNELHYTRFETYNNSTPLDQLFWGRHLINSTYSLLYFEKNRPGQQLIHQIKYKNNQPLAHYLGNEIGKKIKEIASFDTIDALIPIPIHSKKKFIRGYNQSTELCKGINNELNIPIDETLLIKSVNTKSQTKNSKDKRFQNVTNSFKIGKKAPAYKHIALVDDVITTGATLETCIEVLKEKFPTIQISIISLAYTKN
ncbi:MAG: ComF family protein [Crocinitomicaceae bacterium]|nr:ComF family protein [Crocinitomicaceae bacterium]